MAIRRHTMIIRTEFNAEEEPPNDMIKDGTTGKMVQLGHDSGVCYLFLSPWWLKFCFLFSNDFYENCYIAKSEFPSSLSQD